MADVLMQSQIDALFNMVAENADADITENIQSDSQEKEFRKYDFYSPKKFTKDKLRILNDVFEKYASFTIGQIGNILRLPSSAEILAIEEQRYYEFSNALVDNDVLAAINVELPEQAKNKPILMHFSPVIMANYMDRQLGGDEVIDNIPIGYMYTDLEKVLYEKIVKHFVDGLTESWSSYIALDFKFTHMEFSSALLQSIGLDETVVIITANVHLEGVSGMLSICFPANLLSDIFIILDKAADWEWDNNATVAESSNDIFHYIKNSSLNLDARLARVTLDLQDIYNLQPGDVINLNKQKDEEIDICVKGNTWFSGKLGQHQKNVSVLITDVNRLIHQEQEEMPAVLSAETDLKVEIINE